MHRRGLSGERTGSGSATGRGRTSSSPKPASAVRACASSTPPATTASPASPRPAGRRGSNFDPANRPPPGGCIATPALRCGRFWLPCERTGAGCDGRGRSALAPRRGRGDVRALAARAARADRPPQRRGGRRRPRRLGLRLAARRGDRGARLRRSGLPLRSSAGRSLPARPRPRSRRPLRRRRPPGAGPGAPGGRLRLGDRRRPRTGLPPPPPLPGANLPDYQEGAPGDYLGNAIADGRRSEYPYTEGNRPVGWCGGGGPRLRARCGGGVGREAVLRPALPGGAGRC